MPEGHYRRNLVWRLGQDNQLMELIEQFPCLNNRNDEYFKVPWKRNDAVAEIGRILGCDMFEVARRFRQLKEKYITDITESQNEEKFVMCKMDFLQPHLETHSPNNQSSDFVFEFIDIPKESEKNKRRAVDEDHPSKKKHHYYGKYCMEHLWHQSGQDVVQFESPSGLLSSPLH